MPIVKYKRADLLKILTKFVDYIENTPMPIIAEFAYQNNLTDQNLRDFQERKEQPTVKREIEGKIVIFDFSLAYKKAVTKQQVYLVRQLEAIQQGKTPAGLIFLLKAMHNFSDQADQKPQETHVHIHQSAEKVRKMSDDDLTSLIQRELLKPDKRKKSQKGA